MAKNPNDISNEDLENLEEYTDEVFTPEWYDNVTTAINFVFDAFEKDGKRIITNRDQVAKSIIDYNIERRLNETKSQLPIPLVYNWQKYDIIEIFDDFSYVLHLCRDKIGFKKHEMTLKFGRNKKAMNNFYFWKDVLTKELNDLSIETEELTKSSLKCIIRKKENV